MKIVNVFLTVYYFSKNPIIDVWQDPYISLVHSKVLLNHL